MQTRIVTLSSAKIREVARIALEGHWKQMVLFMFFYYLITTGVSNILDLFFVYHQQLPFGESGEMLDQYVYYGSSIYMTVVSGPVSWAMSKFMLDFFRYQKIEMGTILEGFSIFARTLFLMLVVGAKIFLWTLLFIIPGIIATIRYSQAFYVMVDHPEYSALKCVAESCRIMNGNKKKYAFLYLSFIGWAALAELPALIFSFATNQAEGIMLILYSLLLYIPVLFVNVYTNMSMTVFYELATDNLAIVEENPADQNLNDSLKLPEE